MYLSWSLCWYFYLALPAAESDSTSCDLLRGPSTNSGQLSASKACCSGRTCTTFLHRPIGMFLLVVEGTLSHFPISRLHILLWSKGSGAHCSSCFVHWTNWRQRSLIMGVHDLHMQPVDANSTDAVSRVSSRRQLRVSRQPQQLDSTPSPISCRWVRNPGLSWKDLTSPLHPCWALTRPPLVCTPLTSSTFFEHYAEQSRMG